MPLWPKVLQKKYINAGQVQVAYVFTFAVKKTQREVRHVSTDHGRDLCL